MKTSEAEAENKRKQATRRCDLEIALELSGEAEITIWTSVSEGVRN